MWTEIKPACLDGRISLAALPEGDETIAAGAAGGVVPHDARVAAPWAGLEGGVEHRVRHVCEKEGGGVLE